MRLRTVAALTALTQLTGCFFVFIPGSLISKVSDGITGDKGEHCVSRAVKVGDRIRSGEKVYSVVSLSGATSRCADPDMPIRAELALQASTPPQVASNGGPGEEKAPSEKEAVCRVYRSLPPGATAETWPATFRRMREAGISPSDC